MQKKLAIIGASYLQLPLVRKAKEMGLHTICFAWEEGAVCKDEADEFFPISIIEKERILEVCQEKQINGICSIASDVAAPTVAFVAERMQLVGNSYQSSILANNKYQMRQAFNKAGIPCPKYWMIQDYGQVNDAMCVSFPLIVKPTDRSGSLGVTKVNTKNELIKAVESAVSVSFTHQAIVEEYIEGREISVEFISFNGKHYPLQITDKVTTGAPHFVELEHHQPAQLTQEQFSYIYELTSRALDALGLTNGASHSEYRITDDSKVVVMEIGGRMGGDLIGSDLVQLSTGYDYLKGVIEVALNTFTTPEIKFSRKSGIYFLCKETEWFKPIIEHSEQCSEIVSAQITDPILRNIKCSADRSGYAIYQAEKKWNPIK